MASSEGPPGSSWILLVCKDKFKGHIIIRGGGDMARQHTLFLQPAMLH